MADTELSTLGSVIKTAYEGEADTNAFDDAAVATLASALQDVVDDTTPQLGGDLDVNGKEIQSAGDVVMQLGDAAGAFTLSIEDSGGVEIFSINSDGESFGTSTGTSTPIFSALGDPDTGMTMSGGEIFFPQDSINSIAFRANWVELFGTKGEIVFAEKADHSYTPTDSRGNLWVKNTVPNTIIFTDDAGTDHDLTASGGAVEGTAVLSTGETGGTKFLREDGDDTCSWQTVSGGFTSIVDDETYGNYAIGLNALDGYTATSAIDNVCIGTNAGTDITTGDRNVCIGTGAGDKITGGTDNVHIGFDSSGGGFGDKNIAIGTRTLEANTGTDGFIAIGYEALKDQTGVTPSCAVGNNALFALTTGGDNCSIGNSSGGVLTGGSNNTFLGESAGGAVTLGSRNICIGAGSSVDDGTKSAYISIGGSIGVNPIVGYMGAVTDADHSGNVLTITGPSAFATASTNLDAGDLVLQGGTAATTGIGVGGDLILKGGTKGSTGTAGAITLNGSNWVTDDTDSNYGIGSSAMEAIPAGSGLKNLAIGASAGKALDHGDNNILIGYRAGWAITGSNSKENTIIGNLAYDSAITNTEGNTALGYQALSAETFGDDNVAIGRLSMGASNTASRNVAVGNQALFWDAGDENVGLGYKAGYAISSGNYNLLLGSNAADNLTAGSYCIGIGTSIDLDSTTEDDQIKIGNGTTSVAVINGHMGARSDIDHSGKDLTITGSSAFATASTNLDAGDLIIQGGTAATTGIGIGGDLYLRGGTEGATGTTGLVMMDNLPTSDPSVAGALWANSSVLTVSAG